MIQESSRNLVATVLVLSDGELESLRAAGAKVIVFSRYEGFRKDNIEWLRQGWANLWGMALKPARVLRVNVVVNMDWLPPRATQPATNPTTAPTTEATR